MWGGADDNCNDNVTKLGANASKVLKYANSGDVSGDRSGVVGYVSASFITRIIPDGIDHGAYGKERENLKKLVKESIEGVLFGKECAPWN